MRAYHCSSAALGLWLILCACDLSLGRIACWLAGWLAACAGGQGQPFGGGAGRREGCHLEGEGRIRLAEPRTDIVVGARHDSPGYCCSLIQSPFVSRH
jgi:hypothetical protein